MVANVTGEFYATDTSAQAMVEVLGQQVASPVQFVKGLNTLYEAGARVFVEVGPKRALHGFVEDVLGARDDVLALFTNHPKQGDIGAFNQALCGLWAAGLGFESPAMAAQTAAATVPTLPVPMPAPVGPVAAAVPSPAAPVSGRAPAGLAAARDASDDRMLQLGRLTGGHHRRRARPARRGAGLRRRQHRPHPGR